MLLEIASLMCATLQLVFFFFWINFFVLTYLCFTTKFLEPMAEAAGERPFIIVNPRLNVSFSELREMFTCS